MRFTVALPEGVQLSQLNPARPSVTVSPDGRYLAFIGGEASHQSLWIRAVDSLSSQELDKTQGADLPFWSPDSQSIGFFADGKLKRIPISGGTPQILADAPTGLGGSWFQPVGGAGFIVFTPRNDGPIHRVAASGGASTSVTKLANGETATSSRRYCQTGNGCCTMPPVPSPASMQSIGGDPSEGRLVMEASTRAVYAPRLHLVCPRRHLVAQRLDPDSLELQGEAVPIAKIFQPKSRLVAVSEMES
jgi:serine/threonine-protein kinase